MDQGETDFLYGSVSAPIYVSVASYINVHFNWRKQNPVRAAQTKLPDEKIIFAGPDTDTDITPANRYDGLHFLASGQEIFANRWLEILSRNQ
jgi:hypothetical protein